MSHPVLAFGRIAAADLFRAPRPSEHGPEEHLRAAVAWLERAHDATADDGVSYGYSVRGGWRASYIETSGYIAVTFFDLARDWNEPRLRERAVRIAGWLCEVQNPDGSFANPKLAPGRGIVFDTGQDLLGLVRAFEETGDERFLTAARRAARWLVDVADDKGRWTNHTHNGIPHVYNSRVAWALLELNRVYADPGHVRVARANLDWAVSCQQPSGYYDECAFERDRAPFTHTIAYAIRGLLESGRLLRDEVYLDSARAGAVAVRGLLRSDGFLPGQIDLQGRAAAEYCCLTGNAQMAIVWAKLFARDGDEPSRAAAVTALRYVMASQDLETADLDVRGAIKGSQPVWGRYSRLTFPNWPAKFFVDALRLSAGWFGR